MKRIYIQSVVLILVTFFCINLNSQAITIPADEAYKYDGTKTKVLNLNSHDFQSMRPDSYDFIWEFYSSGYRHFTGGSGAFGYADAPFQLPQDAVITELTCWIYDDDASEFTRCRIFAAPHGGAPALQVGVVTTEAGASSAVQELSTPASIVINNNTNYYYVRFESSDNNNSDLRMYNVLIEYTVDQVD